MCFTARKPPKIDFDKVPRELTVKAGKDVEIEVPYVGKDAFSTGYLCIQLIVVYYVYCTSLQD